MKRKRIAVHDNKLRSLINKGGRKGARRDFEELIRRAIRESKS